MAGHRIRNVIPQSCTVVLTNAQIKALPNTPVEILGSRGDGKVPIPICAILTLHLVDVYGNISSPSPIRLALGTLESLARVTPNADANNTFENSPGDYTTVIAGAALTGGGDVSLDGSDILGGSSILLENVNSGNFTGGHDDNTLTVTVWYVVGTLP